jgi:hypothetical protein
MNSTRLATLAALAAAAIAALTATAADANAPKRSDLVVNAVVVVKGAPHPGAGLTLRDATANVGPGRAMRRSRTVAFLSKDDKLDLSDTALGGRQVGRLRAGHTSLGAVPVTLPKALAVGSYTLFACADAKHRVTEKNEANNCTSTALAVTTANGYGPLASLKLSPHEGQVTVGVPFTSATTIFTLDLPNQATYHVEGYDANGHDLGDFTQQAKFDVGGGFCETATCWLTIGGPHPVSASVGSVTGEATLFGFARHVTCRGENYDPNALSEDGCEQAQPFAGHTTQATAQPMGAKTCLDGLIDASFSGTVLSDERAHSPSVPGWDYHAGSAPTWRSVQALGGQCTNDIKLTAQFTGGYPAKCYRVSIKFVDAGGLYASYSVELQGNETKTLTRGAGSYYDGSTAYLEVEKICSTAVREKVSYVVSYHL